MAIQRREDLMNPTPRIEMYRLGRCQPGADSKSGGVDLCLVPAVPGR